MVHKDGSDKIDLDLTPGRSCCDRFGRFALGYASAVHECIQAAEPPLDFGHHRMNRFFVTHVTLNNHEALCGHAFQSASFAADDDYLKTILL